MCCQRILWVQKGSHREAEVSSWDTNPLRTKHMEITHLAPEVPEPETASGWKNIGENTVYRHGHTATAGDEVWGKVSLWLNPELVSVSGHIYSVHTGLSYLTTQRSQTLGTCGWPQLLSVSGFPTTSHLLLKTVLIWTSRMGNSNSFIDKTG